MRENLVVTSAYVRTYVRTNSGGGRGESQGECHPFLAGNSTVLLGNQRSKTFVQRCWSFKNILHLYMENILHLYMERKTSKEYSVAFLWKAKSCLRGVIFVVFSAANLVGTSLSLQRLAAVPTPNIAELVNSVFFFCPQPWFLWRSEHVYPGKTNALLSQSSCER